MIPKIVHYCWFGKSEYSVLIKNCFESWKKNLLGYEFRLWNEDTFDVNSVQYTREAYEAKKYAFVSDYVRLYALKNFGGIYLDTDVEVLKSFDEYLSCDGFSGYEDDLRAGCGIIGCIPNQTVICDFFDHYKNRSFYNDIDQYDLTPNPYWFKKILLKHGLNDNGKTQTVDGFTIYEQVFFCPHKNENNWDISNKTVTIHHYDGSWTKIKDEFQLSYEKEIKAYKKMFGDIWGERIYKNLKRIKKFGIGKWIADSIKRVRSFH